MGQRTDKRKADKLKQIASKQLFDLVAEYVSLIEDKSPDERKDIRNSINLRWNLYAKKDPSINPKGFINMVNKRKSLYEMKVALWKRHPSYFIRLWRSIKTTPMFSKKSYA